MRDIDLTPQSPLARFQARIKSNQGNNRGKTFALRDTAQDHFGKALSNFNQTFEDTRAQQQSLSSRRQMEAMLRANQESLDTRRQSLSNPLGLAHGTQQPNALAGLGAGGLGASVPTGGGYSIQEGRVVSADPDEQFLLQHESSGRPTADNPTSTAFGLGQLLQANREHYGGQLGFSPDTTDPNEQMAMFRAYVQDRYGSMAAARRFWEQNHWY